MRTRAVTSTSRCTGFWFGLYTPSPCRECSICVNRTSTLYKNPLPWYWRLYLSIPIDLAFSSRPHGNLGFHPAPPCVWPLPGPTGACKPRRHRYNLSIFVSRLKLYQDGRSGRPRGSAGSLLCSWYDGEALIKRCYRFLDISRWIVLDLSEDGWDTHSGVERCVELFSHEDQCLNHRAASTSTQSTGRPNYYLRPHLSLILDSSCRSVSWLTISKPPSPQPWIPETTRLLIVWVQCCIQYKLNATSAQKAIDLAIGLRMLLAMFASFFDFVTHTHTQHMLIQPI